MSEYGKQIEKAIEQGSAYGAKVKEARAASGRKVSDGGMVGTMPKILDAQLVQRYGGNYTQDEELMRDLRQRHPEMMALDGDTHPDAIDGVHTKRGRVKMKWVKGKWYAPDGKGGWEEIHPPSKMDYTSKEAPGILGEK